MESLPCEIINHIISYFSVRDLKSLSNLSQTAKYINHICQDRWKALFNQVFPYLFLTTDNYNRLFIKYYNIFSSYIPLLEADDEAIQQLYDLGLDSINLPKRELYNAKSNNISLLIKDYPYGSKQINDVLYSLIHNIGDKLPDINSGKKFPTMVYITMMLKINTAESIEKLYKTIDRHILIKWLFLVFTEAKLRFLPDKPIADSLILQLARMLKPKFEELLSCLADVVNEHNYLSLIRLFNMKKSSLVRFAIYQINIPIIKKLGSKKPKTKDKFCQYIIDLIQDANDVIYFDNYEMIDLFKILVSKQKEYANIIKKIVYRTLKYNKVFANYLFRAAIWRRLARKDMFLLHPFRLRYSYKLYRYIINSSKLDISEEDDIFRGVVQNYDTFKAAVSRTCLYGLYWDPIKDDDFHDHIFQDFLEYIISEPDLVSKLTQLVKLYGVQLLRYWDDTYLINQMDMIADLPMNNNYENIRSYVFDCIRKGIHNATLAKILSRPECIGLLAHFWPDSKQYIDRLNIRDKKIAYKVARRAINLFIMKKFTETNGLEYLLDKLIPKREVDRYLIRSFKNKFVKFFPTRKVNIEDIIFDSIAMLDLPEKCIDNIGNIDIIINKYIDIYPLSCEILINRFWNNKNYQRFLRNNPMYKINKITSKLLLTELYSVE